MFVSIVVIRAIVGELERTGVSRAQALSALDLQEESLRDPLQRVSSSELEMIIQKALAYSGDPSLGLSTGTNAPTSMLQTLGYLIMSSRTPREAFGVFQRYLPLLGEGLTYTLEERGDVGRFTYDCALEHRKSARFAAEYALGMAQSIAITFVGDREQRAHFALFKHPEPKYVRRYREVFRCPVRFNQRVNALVFPRRILEVTQPHADATVNALFRDLADRMLHAHEHILVNP